MSLTSEYDAPVLRRYVPGVTAFLFWVALDVSEYHNNTVSAVLLAVVVVLLGYAAWPNLRRIGRGELRVVLVADEWDNYRYIGTILQVKLRITNLTTHRKRVSGFGVEFEGMTQPPDPSGDLGRQLRQEVEARKHNLPRLDQVSVLDPFDPPTSGWLVFPFGLGSASDRYKVVVTDERGDDYEAHRQPWPVRWLS